MSHHHLSSLTCLIVSSKELEKLSYDPDQGWLRSDRKAGDGQDCLPQWKLFYGLKDLEINSATHTHTKQLCQMGFWYLSERKHQRGVHLMFLTH